MMHFASDSLFHAGCAMRYNDFSAYIDSPRKGRGAVAIVLCEDAFLAEETARFCLKLGFSEVAAIGDAGSSIQDDSDISIVPTPIREPSARTAVLNKLITTFQGRWILVCFNGEFFFAPYSDSRVISDLLEFLWSERRASLLTYSIDLYCDGLSEPAPVFDPDSCYFDSEGWYGFERGDGNADIHGGLGWRYEEITPPDMSRINRPALFRADEGVEIGNDLWLSNELMNTVACPWHHNPTGALMSFRRTRRILSHPYAKLKAADLRWPKSERFLWRSDQLEQHGLIEPGQWI